MIWQAIETAPKTGRRVLLLMTAGGRAFFAVIGSWEKGTPAGAIWPGSPALPDGWVEDGGFRNRDRFPHTTFSHWAELPPPPQGGDWLYETGWPRT